MINQIILTSRDVPVTSEERTCITLFTKRKFLLDHLSLEYFLFNVADENKINFEYECAELVHETKFFYKASLYSLSIHAEFHFG